MPSLTSLTDPASLEVRWRELDARGAGSFFQSWTWAGCLLSERFSDPILLSAEQDGHTLALGLCNRRPTRWSPETLWLGETGAPNWDSVFIEHNGPLLATGSAALLGPCLAALLRTPINGQRRAFPRRVILPGVDDAVLDAARTVLRGACHLRQTRLAPSLDLTSCAGPDAYLATLSRSTRYQLRRSARLYEASGPLRLTRAATVAEGLAFFERLADLHAATWQRRGKPGAFANHGVRRFHHSLIATGLPRGEVDLLRIAAGENEIGYLYNFRWHGRVHAYQSGFHYPANPQQKPGLTCHALAIETYRSQGLQVYDFLAGDDRYKTSLAPDLVPLHWLELAHPLSPRGLALRAAAIRESVASWHNRAAEHVAAEPDRQRAAVEHQAGAAGAVVADLVAVDHEVG